MMIFIDIMTTIGSITEDLYPINHTLPEAEVGVTIQIIIKASSIEVLIDIKVEVDFIQDPEVVEDHFESLIEVQTLEEVKAHQKQLTRIKQIDVFNVIS